jgi:hypothetical protein
MPHHFTDTLEHNELLRLGPMLVGYIRWPKSIGRPSGSLSSGFRVKVEEKPVTEWRMTPDGLPTPYPKPWRTISDDYPTSPLPEEDGSYGVFFRVAEAHTTVLDNRYRVNVSLAGRWGGSLLFQLAGRRRMEPPLGYIVALPPDNPIRVLEFTVVRRPWRWGPVENRARNG